MRLGGLKIGFTTSTIIWSLFDSQIDHAAALLNKATPNHLRYWNAFAIYVVSLDVDVCITKLSD